MWHVRWSWRGDKAGLCEALWATKVCPKSNRKLLVKVTIKGYALKRPGWQEKEKHWRQTRVDMGGLIQSLLLRVQASTDGDLGQGNGRGDAEGSRILVMC